MGRIPDFFIIGAAKAGTTSLYWYLKAHPQIFLPVKKEPRYYAYAGERPEDFEGPGAAQLINSIIKDKAVYMQLFEDATPDQVVGEASPAYLYSPVAAQRIFQDNPDAKIIAILRNPIDRAYSHFLDNVANGWEKCTNFEKVIEAQLSGERKRWWRKWDYIGHGFYAKQLEPYFKLENIKIIRYEDFKEHTDTVVQELLSFLEVDSNVYLPTHKQYNVSSIPRKLWILELLKKVAWARKAVRLVIPPEVRLRIRQHMYYRPAMSPAVRQRLLEVYAKEIEALEHLLGWDLKDWKQL